MLNGKRILLIVSGGIAAYKCPDLVRRLRERGAHVRCVLTEGGSQFVTPPTLAAVSEDKVYENLFSLTDEHEMGHIQLSRDADNWIQAGIAGSLYLRWQNRRCGIVFHRFPARLPVIRPCSVRRGQVGRQLFGARLLCLEIGVVGLFLIRIQQNVSRLRDLIEDLL